MMRKVAIALLAVAIVFGMSSVAFGFDHGQSDDLEGEAWYINSTWFRSAPGTEEVKIDQDGERLTAEVYQTTTGESYAGIGQINADDNTAIINQEAHNSYVRISQYDNEFAEAYVDQWGNQNRTRIYQPASHSKVDVDQDGFWNYARVHQFGENNTADVNQIGEQSGIFILQEGSDPMTTNVTQEGFGNEIVVEQN